MKQNHDEIREKLPEYSSDRLSEAEISEISLHLKNCEECRAELAIIRDLGAIRSDPGNLFWNTLPGKVASLSKKEKSDKSGFRLLLSRASFAAAMLLLAVAALLVYRHSETLDLKHPVPFFSDPFSVSPVDLAFMTDEDLNEIAEMPLFEDDDIERISDLFSEASYHEIIASMSSEEIDSLYRALNNKKQNRGVL